MRHAPTRSDVGLGSAVGLLFLLGSKLKDVAITAHGQNISWVDAYFHRPVSIQLSIRRIGSSHSHAIPAVR